MVSGTPLVTVMGIAKFDAEMVTGMTMSEHLEVWRRLSSSKAAAEEEKTAVVRQATTREV